MKKIRLVLLLCAVTVSFISYGQQKPKFIYCLMSGMTNSKFLDVTISSPQFTFDSKMRIYEDKIMKDEAGKKVKLNGIIDALNFMVKHGWDLDQTYSSVGTDQVIHYYILKKNFDDLDDEVKGAFMKN